jgi:Poxvirus A32 protein
MDGDNENDGEEYFADADDELALENNKNSNIEDAIQSVKKNRKKRYKSSTMFGTLAGNIVLKLDFEGFKSKGHVALIGATGSGKTSWVISQLYKGTISDYDMFYYAGASSLTKEKITEIRDASCFNLEKIQHKRTEDSFMFYNLGQIEDLMHVLNNTEKNSEDKNTIVFFDDIQAVTDGRILKSFLALLKTVKHTNTTVYVSVHAPTGGDNFGSEVRKQCRYFVLFNIEQKQFTTITGEPINSEIFRKYKQISEHQERVFIRDKTTQDYFYANGICSKVNSLYRQSQDKNE